MMHLDDAVRLVCDENQFKWQFNHIEYNKLVQHLRLPVLNKCWLTGNKVSIAKIDSALMKEIYLRNQKQLGISQEDGFCLREPIRVDSPCTELSIGRQWGAEVPALIKEGVEALNNVPRINHPFLREVAEEARELLDTKAAEKFIPGYIFDELDRVGDGVYYLKKDNVEYAGRIHGTDGYNKVLRAISCPPQSRKMTKQGMAIHRQYVRGLGVNRAEQDRILENPAQWVASQKKPTSAMLIVSSVYSLYLAETTGWSPFGIRRDMSASGYSIQLWLLRFRELFMRICTNSSSFVPAHNTMITAMQDGGWARGRWSAFVGCNPKLLMSIAKSAFMVCMYTGGKDAIFKGLTAEDSHHDPSEVSRYVLPGVLEENYFGGLINEAIYPDLLKLCEDLAKLFAKKFTASRKFERYWTKKWEAAKPAMIGENQPYFEGYRVPYPLGGELLIPYLGMSKKHRVSRDAKWVDDVDGELFPQHISCTVFEETFNDYAAVLVTAICRMYDSAILFSGTVRNLHNSSYSDHGMILDATHDEIELHPNDEPQVQENMTQGANKVFEFDLMKTGRPALKLRKGSVIFR